MHRKDIIFTMSAGYVGQLLPGSVVSHSPFRESLIIRVITISQGTPAVALCRLALSEKNYAGVAKFSYDVNDLVFFTRRCPDVLHASLIKASNNSSKKKMRLSLAEDGYFIQEWSWRERVTI